MMWSEPELRPFHDLSPTIALYFGATDNIAKKIFPYTSGKLLYYALVIGHPKERKPSIAVAEMISSSQSVVTLTCFLMTSKHDAAKLYDAKAATPCHIEIDISWAILHSVLEGFLGMELLAYLQRCWRLVEGIILNPCKHCVVVLEGYFSICQETHH